MKSTRMPFTDRTGTIINNEVEWNRARNQQRNWETLQQLISLRAQVFDLTTPEHADSRWTFEFTVEQQDLFRVDNDPVGLLDQDCSGVPMLVKLNETDIQVNILVPKENISFEIVE